jgi:hypothetical protein
LLKKDESAFIPSIDYFTNDQYSGYSGSLHYNYKGLISSGLRLGKSEMKDESSSLNYKRLSLTAYPYKKSEELPMTIGIGVENQFNNFRNNGLDSVYLYYSDNTFILFSDIYLHIPISSQSELIPGISIQYYINSVVAVDTYLNHLYSKSRATSISVFISSGFNISEKVILSIHPELYFDVCTSGYSPTIALGLSFTFK